MTTPTTNPPPPARWFKWFVAAVILANVGLIVYVMVPRGDNSGETAPDPALTEPATNPEPEEPTVPITNLFELLPTEPPPEPLIAPEELSASLPQDSLGMSAD